MPRYINADILAHYAYLYHGLNASQIASFPTADVEPVRHGRWIMSEKYMLIPKTSFDEPFTMQSANIIQIKKHRTVKIPYCSICGNYGDDEYDRTPYCPYCGARMDGDVNDEQTKADTE